ncbi:2,5-diamino-6-(ribosylamino)-4(3H)-pyrimidinone 5'-phosphate reductase [Hypocenomyce scalaris]|nr:2,5-diamino-6-(ribosylamino)-4(3H)-pyrimidinone 5'-phosphate reductase [Hypocenomyce scalaris]
MSALHAHPPNIGAVRERLFALGETVRLAAADFEAYWPYIDNLWSSTGTPRTNEGCKTEYFCCRLHTTENWKPRGGGKRVRERQKPSHTAIGCPMRMRVVHAAGVVTVDRVGESPGHAHALEDSDCYKQPSVFCALATREVANGYSVAEVARNLRGVNCPADRAALYAAEGRWLSLKDIHNACAAWKKQHPASQQ